jgi:hypothetical protein
VGNGKGSKEEASSAQKQKQGAVVCNATTNQQQNGKQCSSASVHSQPCSFFILHISGKEDDTT